MTPDINLDVIGADWAALRREAEAREHAERRDADQHEQVRRERRERAISALADAGQRARQRREDEREYLAARTVRAVDDARLDQIESAAMSCVHGIDDEYCYHDIERDILDLVAEVRRLRAGPGGDT